jgi:glycosyltransferase involved in cell wall biosynthesis
VWIALHWLELGGAEKFALDLIRALPKDRYAVYVTTDVPSENPWAGALEDEVEELIHLPSFLPPHAIEAFCIHYARTRRPRLLHVNHAPRVYESLPRVRRALPELVVLDTLHIVELAAYGGGYPEWAMANFRTFIDHHHVVNRHLKRFLMQRWQIPDGDIDVIFANVDGAWFDPAAVPAGTVRRAHGIPDDALVVGFVGRFTRQKRPLEFVRMAGLLHERWRRETGGRPELHFVMAGGGELLEEVRASIRVAGLGRVLHLHGEVADTRPVYRDCDLIAMPSENEGLALVAYEAMAMATPVFFTDVGAQSELLPREQLVPDEMPVAPALARALWPYLLDGEKRRRTGEAERAYVVEHHRLDQTVAEVRGLYERLLGIPAGQLREAIPAAREGGGS